MLVLITYDVATSDNKGQKRLRKVAKECQNYGQRVQNSVFECEVTYAQYVVLKNSLDSIIDNSADSIRFYLLGNHWEGKVEHIGIDNSFNFNAYLII